MDECARCGHPLGPGRFCVNCGHARTVVAPGAPVPPAAYGTPPQVRYPLYADEAPASTPPAEPAAWESTARTDTRRHEPRSLVPWVAVGIALILVGATGVLLLRGGGDDDRAADPSVAQADSAGPTSTTSTAPSAPDPTQPTTPSGTPRATAPAGEPVDVAAQATATAPAQAAPSRDVDGNAVRYDAFNMLDGQLDTAWRMPGDGTGSTILLELAAPTRLQRVGLVNGYAKSEPGYDGYAANRRVATVEWFFDDGTSIRQGLGEERDVQSIDVDVVTGSVGLRILAVTEPGSGTSGRDYTALSEISLVGVPE